MKNLFELTIDCNTYKINEIHDSKFVVCCDDKILKPFTCYQSALEFLINHLGGRIETCLNLIKESIK